jgi:hypothetical protein
MIAACDQQINGIDTGLLTDAIYTLSRQKDAVEMMTLSSILMTVESLSGQRM